MLPIRKAPTAKQSLRLDRFSYMLCCLKPRPEETTAEDFMPENITVPGQALAWIVLVSPH
jgi:hypothetical protein